MSLWKCKTDDGELGPVSFQELAQLVREGTVKEGALVCREGAGNWEPAWHVPGLCRAAGIAEPGDSPAVEAKPLAGQDALTPAPGTRVRVRRERETMAALTPALSLSGMEQSHLPGYVTPTVKAPLLTLSNVVRGIVAAAVGVLAVGFFYRWAAQAMTAFPMPPAVVDGELVDCYFPIVGRCTMLECGLLYIDVFAVAAAATWHAVEKRGGPQTVVDPGAPG